MIIFGLFNRRKLEFTLINTDNKSKARAGILKTGHGEINTPVFMPVGTLGSVKGIHQTELENDIKAQIILGNTYHLYLRPGIEVIEKAGGLHRFMSWDKPILTDSGGYQVFSLAANCKLTEEGARFSSHIDGSKHLFTPENIVAIQRIIGSDIIMALDECTPYPCDEKYASTSMKMTHRWLKRGVDYYYQLMQFEGPKYGVEQTFFPIVQGSVYKNLRVQSAETVASYKCEGNAIGGLSVGEPAEEMYAMLEVVNNILPTIKPRYLMGVGTPENILESIALGVDMFDCVMPTRNGRNGQLFTKNGIINIKNQQWKFDFSAIDDSGTSFVDRLYSKAYLRHLIMGNEILGAQIASLHNLSFYLWLVNEARKKIMKNEFHPWKEKMVKQLSEKL
jgi:queuine tRNA-ribosyltransferase